MLVEIGIFIVVAYIIVKWLLKNSSDKERLKAEKTHRDNRAEAAKEYTGYIEKWRNASKEELLARQKTLTTTEYNLQELKAVNDTLAKIGQQERENQKEQQKTADDYAKASNQKLQDSLKALEVEAKAKGEAVSAQDKYNVYLQSYIDLMTKTEGLIKEGYPVEQKRLEQLKEAKKAPVLLFIHLFFGLVSKFLCPVPVAVFSLEYCNSYCFESCFHDVCSMGR